MAEVSRNVELEGDGVKRSTKPSFLELLQSESTGRSKHMKEGIDNFIGLVIFLIGAEHFSRLAEKHRGQY